MKEGQTQEPVGGMKWEDVQALAKKHAEHIIEMGWRDNPDKDDIIADFISGYASAPPPAPEGEDEKFMPPDNGDICWEVGAKTFTRKEVAYLLYTQRAMISNDLKYHCGDNLTNEMFEILDNPRKPTY